MTKTPTRQPNRYDVLARIRRLAHLPDTAVVGQWASIGTKTSVDMDQRNIVGSATTDDTDLDNEVIVQEGADTRYFFKNRKIFVDHQYGADTVVGTLRSASPILSGNGIQTGWKIRVYMAKGLPLADDVLTIAKEIGIGMSVGFEATDYGPVTEDEKARYGKGGKVPVRAVRSWRWLETSLTPFPCNVSCQASVVRADDQKMADLDRLVCKGLIRRASAEMLGLGAESRKVKTWVTVPV